MTFIKKIILFFQKIPVHSFLLPVFFILHIYIQFGGLLTSRETIGAWLMITGSMLVFFLLCRWLLKNTVNAGITTTLAAALFLFFGNLKIALEQSGPLSFLGHYKILLPVLFLLIGFLLYRIIKSRPLFTFNLFLNILLLIYISIELINYRQLRKNNAAKNAQLYSQTSGNGITIGDRDIYYLVLDCYPSSGYQQEVLQAPFNQLDSNLSARGFFVVQESRSNYHYTAFSMASLFQMDYIAWLKNTRIAKPYHYNRATNEVENSPVVDLLMRSGVALHNLSVFDLAGHASMKKEHFLTTTGTAVIFYYTLWSCLRRDVMPHFLPLQKAKLIRTQRANNKKLLGQFSSYNRMIMDSLLQLAEPPGTKGSKFIYAHLEMPHFPYFYDSTGNAYPEELVFGKEMITHKERFRNYIGYTNKKITALLDSMASKNRGQDIIIIQSDHGLNDIRGSAKSDAFRNYSAFYFPDRDYSALYHGMSNVNTFRIILNKYFGQQLPLLPDSTILVY